MLLDFLFGRIWDSFPRNLLLKLLNLILDTLVERWVVEGGRGLLIKWIIPTIPFSQSSLTLEFREFSFVVDHRHYFPREQNQETENHGTDLPTATPRTLMGVGHVLSFSARISKNLMSPPGSRLGSAYLKMNVQPASPGVRQIRAPLSLSLTGSSSTTSTISIWWGH